MPVDSEGNIQWNSITTHYTGTHEATGSRYRSFTYQVALVACIRELYKAPTQIEDLAHTRTLTEKPIKKALGELRVIRKSVAENEDQTLRIDEFTELAELIKSRIANATSVDEIQDHLKTLDVITQEAKNIFMSSIPKPGSQPQPKKEEKSAK